MPGGFRRNSAGIRRNYCRHSAGIPLEFRTFPAGIPPDYCRHSASIQMEFQPEFHRNYCRHSAGIPLEFQPEFRRNYCRHSAGIPLEFQPEFRWNYCRNSAGIPLKFQPEFRRNYCRHSAGIPLEFQPEFCRNYCRHSTGIPLELLPAYRWYSGQLQLEFHWNSWPEYCWNSRIRIEFWLGKNYCQHIARILDFFTQHWFRIHTYKLNIHAYISFIYTQYQVIQIKYYADFHRSSLVRLCQ